MKLTVKPEGFFTSTDPATVIRWDEIRKITAYQREHFGFDRVTLDFETVLAGLEVHEETRGWRELVNAVERQYSVSSDWYARACSFRRLRPT